MNSFCWNCKTEFQGVELHTCTKCRSGNVYVGEKLPETKCLTCGKRYRGEYAKCPSPTCNSKHVQIQDLGDDS